MLNHSRYYHLLSEDRDEVLRRFYALYLTHCGEERTLSEADFMALFGRELDALFVKMVPTLEEAERDLIVRALSATAGNKLQAARMLRISRHRLYDKLRKFSIEARP